MNLKRFLRHLMDFKRIECFKEFSVNGYCFGEFEGEHLDSHLKHRCIDCPKRVIPVLDRECETEEQHIWVRLQRVFTVEDKDVYKCMCIRCGATCTKKFKSFD